MSPTQNKSLLDNYSFSNSINYNNHSFFGNNNQNSVDTTNESQNIKKKELCSYDKYKPPKLQKLESFSHTLINFNPRSLTVDKQNIPSAQGQPKNRSTKSSNLSSVNVIKSRNNLLRILQDTRNCNSNLQEQRQRKNSKQTKNISWQQQYLLQQQQFDEREQFDNHDSNSNREEGGEEGEREKEQGQEQEQLQQQQQQQQQQSGEEVQKSDQDVDQSKFDDTSDITDQQDLDKQLQPKKIDEIQIKSQQLNQTENQSKQNPRFRVYVKKKGRLDKENQGIQVKQKVFTEKFLVSSNDTLKDGVQESSSIIKPFYQKKPYNLHKQMKNFKPNKTEIITPRQNTMVQTQHQPFHNQKKYSNNHSLFFAHQNKKSPQSKFDKEAFYCMLNDYYDLTKATCNSQKMFKFSQNNFIKIRKQVEKSKKNQNFKF